MKYFTVGILSKLAWSLNACLLSISHIKRLDAFHMWCLRAILGIPHSYYSRVPNLSIWEGTNSCPISILIWERMLRYVGHLMRARDEDPTKAVALELRHGHWVPPRLIVARARGRPHDGWAFWAWGEARRAAKAVASSTATHIASFPENLNSQAAHDATALLMQDAKAWRRISYVARCLRHQSFLASLREARG